MLPMNISWAVTTPADTGCNGGITLKGATDKTLVGERNDSCQLEHTLLVAFTKDWSLMPVFCHNGFCVVAQLTC